jgi:hypothetical protein
MNPAPCHQANMHEETIVADYHAKAGVEVILFTEDA